MRRSLRSAYRGQQGLTFIEVLVALGISALILAGVMQALLSSQRNAVWSDDVAYIQENARYALEILSRDARRAGYWGCAVNGGTGMQFFNSLNVDSDHDWFSFEAMRGYEGGSGNFPDGLAGADGLWEASASYAGSTDYEPDAVIFRAADDSLDLNVDKHKKGAATFTLTRNNPLAVGDLAVVVSEDCTDAGLMQMTGPGSGGENVQFVHNKGNKTSPGNCTKVIRYTESFDCNSANMPAKTNVEGASYYKRGSFLMRFAAVGYYVGVSAVDNTQPALFRVQFSSFDDGDMVMRRDEIAMGVEDLQILYGLDSDSDGVPDSYVRASDIDADADEWQGVVSTRFTLLLRGIGNVRNDSGAIAYIGYPFAGADDSYSGHTYSDSVLRQQVSKTIRVRNAGNG